MYSNIHPIYAVLWFKGELHLNLTFTLANTLTNVMRHDFKDNICKLYIF